MSLIYWKYSLLLLLWIARCNAEETTLNCGFPGISARTTINGSADILTNVTYQPGTVVVYECQPGFRLRNGKERTCQNNGQWSATIPWCDRNIAFHAHVTDWKRERAPSITDGLTKEKGGLARCVSLGRNNSVEIQLNDSYAVREVHLYLQEDIDRENLRGDTLSVSQQGACLREEVVNRDLKYVDYFCNVLGDEFNSTEQTTIKFHQEKGNAVVCEIEVYEQQKPSSCGHPEIPSHGNVVIYSNVIDDYLVASYECLQGYQLDGPRQRKCTGMGWSLDQPVCRENIELMESSGGILLIIFLIIIPIAAIAAVAFLFYKHASWRKAVCNLLSGNADRNTLAQQDPLVEKK